MMTAERVYRLPSLKWDEALSRVSGAAVFIDELCAESLHWNRGAASLLEAGARSVRRFSSFESGAEDEPKAVFLVSASLAGRTADVIRDVVSLSRFRHCVVLSAATRTSSPRPPADGANPELEGGGGGGGGCRPPFERFEEQLREWMGGASCAAEVAHVPLLLLAPVAPRLLLLLAPALARLLPPPLPRDARSPSPELRVLLKAAAAELDALLEAAELREECFAVGPTSRLIAAELEAGCRARSRRKAASGGSSRSRSALDLAGAVAHHGDSLVEKILSALPPLPGHRSDVQVDMLELTGLPPSPENRHLVAPGCLAQPQDAAAQALWDSMLSNKQKEAVMEVRRHLVEAASKEKLPIKMGLGRVTADQLSSYARLFKGNAEALERHCGLLQLSLATAHTLRHPSLSRWDTCLAFERLLLQALGDSDLAAVLKQIRVLVGASATGSREHYSVDEVLTLLVYVYGLGVATEHESEQQQEESKLIGALALAVTMETELSPLLRTLTGCETPAELTAERAHSAMQRVFDTLRGVASARAHLKQLRSVYHAGDGVHQATYRPFLKQLLEEIYQGERADCPDVEHVSAGITELLKTGFSMFMKVSRPHPSDHALLILFVVGGVTPSELRLIREVVSTLRPGTQVLVLSTRLLKPTDVPELLFSKDSLAPDISI
uniref:Sec1 family domain containing 2 n=1 Tax=Scleropages formosus TaxID=113540 RepID=A0A8C9WT55_SCLFO